MTITHCKTYFGYSVYGKSYLVEFTRDIANRWTVCVYLNRGAIERNELVGRPFRLSIGRKPTKQLAIDHLKLALASAALE